MIENSEKGENNCERLFTFLFNGADSNPNQFDVQVCLQFNFTNIFDKKRNLI